VLNTPGRQLCGAFEAANLYIVNGAVRPGIQSPAPHTWERLGRTGPQRSLLDLVVADKRTLGAITMMYATPVLRVLGYDHAAVVVRLATPQPHKLSDRARLQRLLPPAPDGKRSWHRFHVAFNAMVASQAERTDAIGRAGGDRYEPLVAAARAAAKQHVHRFRFEEPLSVLRLRAALQAAQRERRDAHSAVTAERRRRRHAAAFLASLCERERASIAGVSAAQEAVLAERLRADAAFVRSRLFSGNPAVRFVKAAHVVAWLKAGEAYQRARAQPSATRVIVPVTVVGEDGVPETHRVAKFGRGTVLKAWPAHFARTCRPHPRRTALAKAAAAKQAAVIASALADTSRCGVGADEQQRELCRPLEPKELSDAGERLRNYKAVAADAIATELLRYGMVDHDRDRDDTGKPCSPLFGEAVMAAVMSIGRDLLERGIMPPSFLAGSIVHACFKGKGDVDDPTGHRPITVAAAGQRLLANVLHARLAAFAEARGTYGEAQFGFRAGRSTQDACWLFTEAIRARLRSGRGRGRRHAASRRTYVAFIDFSKAFDGTDHTVLFSLLYDKCGVRGDMWRAMRAWYTGVSKRVLVAGVRSEPFFPKAGVHQGCCASPGLFLHVMWALAEKLAAAAAAVQDGHPPPSTAEVFVQLMQLLYADDACLLLPSAAQLAAVMAALADACDVLNLRVNTAAGKTEVVVFRPAHELTAPPDAFRIMYRGEPLRVVDAYEYLGVLMDYSLSMDRQLGRAVRNVSGGAHTALAARTSALLEDPKVLRFMWFGLGQSPAEGCSAVWLDPLTSARYSQVDRALDRSLAEALGLSGSSPVAARRGEFGWLGTLHRLDRARLSHLIRVAHLPPSGFLRRVHDALVAALAADGVAASTTKTGHVKRHSSWYCTTLLRVRAMGLPDALVLDTVRYLKRVRHAGPKEGRAWALAKADAFHTALWVTSVHGSSRLRRSGYAALHPRPTFPSYLGANDVGAARVRTLRCRLRVGCFFGVDAEAHIRAGLPSDAWPPCSQCGAVGCPETGRHMLVHCEVYAPRRRAVVRELCRCCPDVAGALSGTVTPAVRARLLWHLLLGGDLSDWVPRPSVAASVTETALRVSASFVQHVCAARVRAARRPGAVGALRGAARGKGGAGAAAGPG
jgi:hypothetical protein